MAEKYLDHISYSGTSYAIKVSDIASPTGEAYTDALPFATGTGGIEWKTIQSGITSFGGQTGEITAGTGIYMNNKSVGCNGLTYSTTVPTADNDQGLKIVVLSSSTSITTYYSGWLYIILE